MENIGVVLHLENPTKPRPENLSATLRAKLKVGDIFLQSVVLLPELSLEACLVDGSEIDVMALLQTFAPGLELPGKDRLSIYSLAVFAQAQKGKEAFYLEAAARGAITILTGLQLEALRFFFAYDQGALSEARFGSTLLLSQSNVEISLLADYQHDNGWQLNGETGRGQQLSINDLLGDLAAP